MISPGDVAPEPMCWSLSFLSLQSLADIEGSDIHIIALMSINYNKILTYLSVVL